MTKPPLRGSGLPSYGSGLPSRQTFGRRLLVLSLGLSVGVSGLSASSAEPARLPGTTTPGATLTIGGPRAVPLGGRIVLEALGAPAGSACHWSIDPVPGAGSGRVRLVNPSVSTYARGAELTVHGKQVSPRAGDVRVRLTCTRGGVELRASTTLTCVDGDLTAYRPQHGGGYFPFARTVVGEQDEEDPVRGAGIRRSDQPDVDPAGEDDLIELRVQAQPAGVPFILVRQDPSLGVWTTRDRTPGTALSFSGNRSAPIQLAGGGGQATLWVEWSAAFHGLADLRLKPEEGPGTLDRLAFHSFQSIVFALGGEDQVPSLPVSSNHGTFLVGTALYKLGYDVHLYDEDHVAPDGLGKVYLEASTAIRNRSVSQVIAFGYSHGGGSTHDLSERLDADRATLGTFQIPFTSYVDGVENDSDFDIQQENRFPPGSAYHANQYQRGSLADLFLDGGPVPGSDPPPSGLDVETTPWGAGTTHFLVDDFLQVRDFIRDNLDQRVTP